MLIDYLSLRGVEIETDTTLYRGHWFQFVDGAAKILDPYARPIISSTGEVVHSADQEWVFSDTEGSTWQIRRYKGCNCSGSAILMK